MNADITFLFYLETELHITFQLSPEGSRGDHLNEMSNLDFCQKIREPSARIKTQQNSKKINIYILKSMAKVIKPL